VAHIYFWRHRAHFSLQRVEASHWEHIIAMAGLQKSAYFKK
jgi:hypothetical protein